MFRRLGHAVVHHPWLTIAGWVVAAVVIGIFAPNLNTTTEQSEFLPDNYESVQATELAQEAFPEAENATALFVVKHDDGSALSQADQETVQGVADDLAAAGIEDVSGVQTGPESVSENQRIQLVNVVFDSPAGATPPESTMEAATELRERAGELLSGTGLSAGLTGDVAYALDSEEAFEEAEQITFLATIGLIIFLLLMIFRSPVAALMPIVTVFLVSIISLRLIGLTSEVFDLQADSSLTILLTVVLYGVGTDYILFLLFRYRERLRAGDHPKDALITAVGRIGEVIASAAAVVIIAFSALALSLLGMFQTMGPSLAIAVAVMLVAVLTLIPAVISIIGPRVFWPSKKWLREPKGTLPQRIGDFIGRRPVTVVAASGGVLVLLAVGALSYKPNYDFNASLPSDIEAAEAFEDLQTGFPPGALNPVNIYLTSEDGGRIDEASVTGFADELATVDGVGSVRPPQVSPDGTVAQVDALLADSPSSNAAIDAVEDSVRPAAHEAAPDGTRAMVGGSTAIFADFRDANARDYRVVFPIAGVLIAIVLALLLRSVVAPWYLLAAVVMTFFATLGTTVMVFQGLLGNAGLIFMMPLVMYLFVVAIGTDYNILTVARLREEARQGNDPREAARLAARHTSPSVASAGTILAGTFASLLLSNVGMMNEIGLAVSVGILISAFVMAMFLVPALTALIGHTAWWPGHGDEPQPDGVAAAREPEAEALPTGSR